MKKTLFLALALITTTIFTSCSKDDDSTHEEPEVIIPNEPGEIPGLGGTEGELTGTPFILPEGIVLDGEITGASSIKSNINEKNMDRNNGSPIVKAYTKVDTVIGSGYYVQLLIPIKNNTSQDKVVVFPARLVVKSLSSAYQNGVLLKEARVTIPANKSYGIQLLMYCGNRYLSSSSVSNKYEWAVISNSSLIADLCNRLQSKKINYEEYSTSEKNKYSLIAGQLQVLLWNLTDYSRELTEENIEYINNLPNSL